MTNQAKDLLEATDVLSGTSTLWGMPVCNNIDELSADIAFLGVPYDGGGELFCRANTKFAPKAMREARTTFAYTDPVLGTSANGWFDMDTEEWLLKGVTMADCGNVNIRPDLNNERNFNRTTTTVKRILDRGAVPLVIGGDHTISFPVVRAFDRFDPLDIVHFDAHLDFLDQRGGSDMFNATPIRRISELPFIHNITTIGVRCPANPNSKEMYDSALKRGVKLITADMFRKIGVSKVVESVPQAKNLYVTFDIDVLDPSVAPGQSFPQPGGLTYLEMRDALIGVAKKGKVVGIDLVCISPVNDCSQMTTHAAAELLLNLVSAAFPSKK